MAILVAIAVIMYVVLRLATNPLTTYLTTLVLVTLLLYGLIYWIAFLLLSRAVRLLPPAPRGPLDPNQRQFRIAMHGCTVFLLVVGWLINHYWLPSRYHPLTLVGDAGFFLYVAVVARGLAGGGRLAGFAPPIASATVLVAALAVSANLHTTEEAPRKVQALRTLPYVTWVQSNHPNEEAGVTYHTPEKSWNGLNFFNSIYRSAAYVMDMSGNILHEWSVTMDDDPGWHHAEPCPNGDLLAIVNDRTLVRVDWNSNLVGSESSSHYHHDVAIANNGDIYALTLKDEVVKLFGVPVPSTVDYVTVLTPGLEVREEFSLLEPLKSEVPVRTLISIYEWLLRPANLVAMIRSRINGVPGYGIPNLLHANSIEIIDRDIDDTIRRGHLLFCSRTLNLIGVLDPQGQSILWKWGGGILDGPHHPTLLENGNILVFDNGYYRGYTRILEIEPATGDIVWEYEYEPREQFFSPTRGSNQRLPNGNTLITNSDAGHAFEVTAKGEIVWEFYDGPKSVGNHEREAMYRLMRLYDLDNYPALRALQQSSEGG